ARYTCRSSSAGNRHLPSFPTRRSSDLRKIYREDLIRQKSLTTFSYLNPVYGREVAGTTVSPADSAQTDRLRSDSLFLQDSIHLRSEEHTSELQSRENLVCRLLLEKTQA